MNENEVTIPVHMKSSKCIPKYNPVSLTSAVCKRTEKSGSQTCSQTSKEK